MSKHSKPAPKPKPFVPLAAPVVRMQSYDPVVIDRMLKMEYKKGFMDAKSNMAESLIKEIYAAIIVAARRKFRFGKKRICRLLGEVDDIITMQVVDSDEAIELAFREAGIVMNFHADEVGWCRV